MQSSCTVIAIIVYLIVSRPFFTNVEHIHLITCAAQTISCMISSDAGLLVVKDPLGIRVRKFGTKSPSLSEKRQNSFLRNNTKSIFFPVINFFSDFLSPSLVTIMLIFTTASTYPIFNFSILVCCHWDCHPFHL